MFEEFPKIPRFNREVIITEKIDGTNGQVFVWDEGYVSESSSSTEPPEGIPWIFERDGLHLAVGSRSRWLTLKDDNFGFAKFVMEYCEGFLELGHGRHFGEWWGQGIQRGYGLDEKRFSLFNTHRWSDPVSRPAPCHVVPILEQGKAENLNILVESALENLKENGSLASVGFYKPEGIIIFHTAANSCFKVTIEKDDEHKGKK